MQHSFFWFRRDLRLSDNAGLYHALKAGTPVRCIFIFDTTILDKLDNKTDARVHFISNQLNAIQKELTELGSTLEVHLGTPLSIWKNLINENTIAVYANEDYEPYAINRDQELDVLLNSKGISFHSNKDQCVFHKGEVLKKDGTPYTVFTPYSKVWKSLLTKKTANSFPTEKYFDNFFQTTPLPLLDLNKIGFTASKLDFPQKEIDNNIISDYSKNRDFPAMAGTSRLGLHLRFGTISIRQVLKQALTYNETFLNELIWRDFYMMILFHFPLVTNSSFKKKYDRIEWLNNETDFQAWCDGKTGYPLVDAGMRELNATGFMHNRVRMLTASFLTKHLLIDWRWGEAYFAEKLLDYDLSANNGGWQWAAGCGCDAAPYFRIFNPTLQTKKFDPELKYIRKWVPEFDSLEYTQPIVEHTFAKERALTHYKKYLNKE